MVFYSIENLWARSRSALHLCCITFAVGGLLSVVAACVHGAAPSPQSIAAGVNLAAPMGRLPEGVKPVGYTLALAVNPAMDYVTGTVKIDVQLESSTTLIWLHGQDLQVGEGYAVADNGKRHRLVYSQATEDGVARLDVTPALPAGQAALNLRFVAPYSTGLAGLYRVKANAVPYVFSQFEPLFARRAFPCFDEPRFKVPFQISLSIPDGLTAVTNTQPVGERSTGNGYTTLIFAATNPLPTYLLAVAVGPFDLVAAEVPRNSLRTHPLPLRGVAVAGRGPQMHYAVGHTAVLLDALERYFLSPYPFDKLDVLAVPDFAASAMENAGAITFRDWLLLMAPQQASVAQKHAFQSVMAHELSHQWFGNWVTMAWWDDLWLNESFATWMGQRTAQSVDPNGHYDLELLRGMHDVMSQDVLASARRVRQPCPRANDVHSAFDGITYSKGGALLNMFEHFMSKERFMVGIRRYLQSHANGTATADDFLADLSWAAGEPRLGEDFRTFLDQTGVPEVRFEVIGGPEHYALRLSQRPYMPLGRETLPKALWHIPVCWRAQSDGIVREACTVLRTAEAEVPLVGGEPTWLMPNAGGVGYYQWDLEPARLAKLTAAPLTAGESLAVARNLRRAYDAGTLAPETVLEAVASFVDGPGHDVALVPLALWADAYDMLSTPKARQQAAAYMAAKISPRFFALLKGAKGASPDDDAWGRDLGRFLSLTLHDKAVRDTLAAMGAAALEATAAGHAPQDDGVEVADLSLAAAADVGAPAAIDSLIGLLARSGNSDAGLRLRLVGALAQVQHVASAARVRALLLQADPVRSNEIMQVLRQHMAQPHLREATWAFIKHNFMALKARLPDKDCGNLAALSGYFCDLAHMEDAQGFFAPYIEGLAGGPRALALATEQVRLCVAQRAAHAAGVQRFFAAAPTPPGRSYREAMP